jgi:hypothetical protein
MLTRVQPYDPADSPGPLASVIERFRPLAPGPGSAPELAAEVARFTVVLVPPEAAEALGYDRDGAGLKVYRDDEWDCDVRSLRDAADAIEDECGVPVTLVERHSDLCYWTARLRQGHQPLD